MKCSRDTIYISKFVFFLVFDIVHNFFYPHFPIRFRHPQVSSPRFADTSFASRFFELFTLPASLKLNTQRRSAPSMYVSEGSNHVTATWKKDFVCLFIFWPSALLVFFLLLFLLSAFFSIRIFLSAFYHPHPPSADIRSAFYRHPLRTDISQKIVVACPWFPAQ